MVIRFALTLILTLQFLTMSSPWSFVPQPYISGESEERVDRTHYRPPQQSISAVLQSQTIPTAQSLVFVGDVLLARNVEVLAKRHGQEYLFKYFTPSSYAPDPYVIGNFEATVPREHIPTPSGQLRFSVSDEMISLLEATEFSAFSLANNHSLDYGEDAFLHTTTQLSEHSLTTFGHGNTVSADSITYTTIDGVTVAIIAVHALVSIDITALESTFKRARGASDAQIVYVHWGNEYELLQNSAQRKLAETFVQLGADLVVGHHPHVTQGIELIDGVPVFYSLGNFLFDQYFSKDVQEGLVIVVTFAPTLRITLQPYSSRYALSQPHPMTVLDRYAYLNSLAQRSSPELMTSVLASEIITETSFASSPKMAIISQ